MAAQPTPALQAASASATRRGSPRSGSADEFRAVEPPNSGVACEPQWLLLGPQGHLCAGGPLNVGQVHKAPLPRSGE